MNEFRFILDTTRPSKKFICPGCGRKRFVRYIDRLTGDYAPPEFGRCDREHECGYFMNPIREGYNPEGEFRAPVPAPPPRPPSFIDPELFRASLQRYEHNYFIAFLSAQLGEAEALRLAGLYNIGTSKHWPGSTVFWQIDQRERVHSGKIMLYNPETGKRVKEPQNCITWVHSALKLPEFNLNQCLFGESLLAQSERPAAIVESEKTAVIASAFFSQFVWLASGSLSGINEEKVRPLKGRRVVLFPDLGAFDKWEQKAKEYGFEVSSFLEQKAPESDRRAGYDLADYLLKGAKVQKCKVLGKTFFSTPTAEPPKPAGQTTKSKEEILAGLIAKNPAIQELIERLDCIIYEETSETPANN